MSSRQRRRKNRLQGKQWGKASSASRQRHKSHGKGNIVAKRATFWSCPRCTLHNPIERPICDACQGSRPVQVLVNNAKIHRPVEAPKSTSDHKRDSPSLVCAARTKTRALGNSSSCPKKGNGSSCPKKGNQARNFPISFSNIDSVMRFAEVSIPVPRSAHRGLCWPHPNPNTNTDATASQQPRSAYHSLNQRPEPKPPADSFGPTWHGKSPHVIIVWFRQDLRLDDNPALHAAVHSLKSANGKNGKNGKNSKNGKNGPKPMIVPLFVQPTDDEEGGWPCRGAAAFWLDQSLRALDASLRRLGSELIVKDAREFLPSNHTTHTANPNPKPNHTIHAEEKSSAPRIDASLAAIRSVIRDLHQNLRVDSDGQSLRLRGNKSSNGTTAPPSQPLRISLHFNRVATPWHVHRDSIIQQRLGASGIRVRTFKGVMLYEPWEARPSRVPGALTHGFGSVGFFIRALPKSTTAQKQPKKKQDQRYQSPRHRPHEIIVPPPLPPPTKSHMVSPLAACRLSQVVVSLPVGALRLARMPAVVPLAISAARGGSKRTPGRGGGVRTCDVSKEKSQHVVRKQKDACVCPICLDRPRQPTMLAACSHVFCNECIRRSILTEGNTTARKITTAMVRTTFKVAGRGSPNPRRAGKHGKKLQGRKTTSQRVLTAKKIPRKIPRCPVCRAVIKGGLQDLRPANTPRTIVSVDSLLSSEQKRSDCESHDMSNPD